MTSQLNSSITQEYKACKHSAVHDGIGAVKALNLIDSGNAEDITKGLHNSGHWQATLAVADEVPQLQKLLATVSSDVAQGQFDPSTQGEYVAYILRTSTALQYSAGAKPSAANIYEVFNKGLQSDSGQFRVSLTACTGRALHFVDRARNDGLYAVTDGFIDQVLAGWQSELHQAAPSELRHWFVRGVSYSSMMPKLLGVYSAMLQHGSRDEVGLAVFAVEGLVTEISSTEARRVPGYVEGLKAWGPHFKQGLVRLRDGGNAFCKGAQLITPIAGTSEDLNLATTIKDRTENLIRQFE